MSEKKQTIDIIEVGPRDGFQNLCSYLPTDRKIYYIEQLIAAGLKHLQITSFVRSKLGWRSTIVLATVAASFICGIALGLKIGRAHV